MQIAIPGVSASAMTGMQTRAAERRTASAISDIVRKFRSGRPSIDALVFVIPKRGL
jgi:hypothetical protein